MSHFTTIQTQIRDLDALRDACGELGLGFLANANCRGYAGKQLNLPTRWYTCMLKLEPGKFEDLQILFVSTE